MSDALKKAQSSHPRNFASYKYVYPVISRRSGGLSIGINLNPDKNCNFDCPYCQVDRTEMPERGNIDLKLLKTELEGILASLDERGVCLLPQFHKIEDKNKILKDLALSGDGEPTMAPEFLEVCSLLEQLQANSPLKFKLVLITNGSLLSKTSVQKGLSLLLKNQGNIWVKLDAGTEEYYQKVNVSQISLEKIINNITNIGQKFPLTVQTLFYKIDGEGPDAEEINQYISRLRHIIQSGAKIKEIQLHSIARKPSQNNCSPMEIMELEKIAGRVLIDTQIKAKVYF